MIRFELETRIERPPSEVFAYLANPANLSRWQGAAEVEQLSEGAVEKGTRFREVHTMLGRRIESVTEVVAYEPGRRFDVRVVSGPVPLDGRWELEPDADGTRLRFSAEGGGPRLLGPLVRRRFRAHHDRLKRAIENEP